MNKQSYKNHIILFDVIRSKLCIVGLGILSLMLGACVTPSMIKPADLKAYSSDGCSYYPDGTWADRAQWKMCCEVHDQAYWAGGEAQKRKHADHALKQCVRTTGASYLRAKSMWLGVRAAGVPVFPGSFRWGYGWPYYRGYKAISAEEQIALDRKEGL